MLDKNTVFGFWVVILPKALAHSAHTYNSSSNQDRKLPSTKHQHFWKYWHVNFVDRCHHHTKQV